LFHYVKVQNLLADLRTAPYRPRRLTKKSPATKDKEYLSPPPMFYDILDKQVPMCFSSYLSNPDGGGSRYCIKPWVVTMNFYMASDVPLGAFLLSYCFDNSYRYLIFMDQFPMLTRLKLQSRVSRVESESKGGVVIRRQQLC
jgi:hypothetical protein